MTVTSPATQARATLKSVIESEFAGEGFPVRDDHLHESLGWEGTVIGLSPIRERPWNKDKLVLNTEILVQFYGRWKKEINPETRVDPAKIEAFGERFRRAVEGADPKTPTVWYFNVLEVNYPGDPTGNKTRFEARVEAVGNNSAIIETTG